MVLRANDEASINQYMIQQAEALELFYTDFINLKKENRFYLGES